MPTTAIDPDDLHRTVDALMGRHEAATVRVSTPHKDGSVYIIMGTCQVYQYWPNGETVLTSISLHLPGTQHAGVQYITFVDLALGSVGYLVVDVGEEENPDEPSEEDAHSMTFIYFSPVDHSDGERFPAVEVYKGLHAHPQNDTKQAHIEVWS